MSPSARIAAATQASSTTPRLCPSTITRAARGWTANPSIERPVSVNLPPSVEGAQVFDGSVLRPRAGALRVAARATARRSEHQAHGELEPRLCQIEPANLGRVMLWPRIEVGACVESQASPRSRASRAPCSLRCRRAARLLEPQTGQARPGCLRRHACQPGVDDRDDPLDGHRRFGDVRREDHLAPFGRPDGGVLLLRRQIAVKGDDEQIGVARDLLARLPRPADLGRAR